MTVREQFGLQIDRMRLSDLTSISAIEVASFPEPWTREMFWGYLQGGGDPVILVARVTQGGGADLIGYICLRVVAGELHIDNLAVAHPFRRLGVARELLEAAFTSGRERGADSAILEVRASNLVARRLYERHDFVVEGVRRRYYSHPVEDAVLMRKCGV